MVAKMFKDGLTRRRLLGSGAAMAGSAAAAAVLPRTAFAADKVVKIGFLAPLTGPVAKSCVLDGESYNT